jgi:glutamate N-acetyltransferase/amino-acid N-acetyltransferase
MWTTNRVQAAPVVVSRRHLEAAEPQAIVVNAGVANAATGRAGEDDAAATAAHVASLLDLEPEQVVVMSTGVIGPRLPMDRLARGVERAVAGLSPDGGPAAAEAILTTDSGPKTAVAQGDGFTVGGMAKGAGMIHPCLATMLAVVTTDYPLTRAEADAVLRPAVDKSFNRISVDGDCSTNDAVVLLANGACGIPQRSSKLDEQFVKALGEVCSDLARQIVADGEGATLVLEIRVSSASSPEEAEAIARRVATSPLVKTAAFGRDPNWGRVLAAAGSAPWNGGFAHLDPERLSVSFDGTEVFAAGSPTGRVPELAGSECRIELDLGLGSGEAAYLASDLSYDYVKLNAEYTT